jgi:hypothetical protein
MNLRQGIKKKGKNQGHSVNISSLKYLMKVWYIQLPSYGLWLSKVEAKARGCCRPNKWLGLWLPDQASTSLKFIELKSWVVDPEEQFMGQFH